MKHSNKLIILYLCLFSFFSCNEDNDNNNGNITGNYSNGVYILNQGNYYANIGSSIDFLNYNKGEKTDSIFMKANLITPGNTLQAGVICGENLYIAASESNIVFIVNKNTMKEVSRLKLEDNPRDVIAYEDFVYVSEYDGYVLKINNSTMTIENKIKVGPNPEEMAIANGYLYVTNSDGLNYEHNYEDGKSVSKINLKTFQVEKNISVGLNPTKIIADSQGCLFVIAMGNYNDVPSKIQKISEERVEDIAEAIMFDVADTILYCINSKTNWSTGETANNYFTIGTKSCKKLNENFIATGVDYPITIGVEPNTKEIFISSNNKGSYGADYNSACYINHYNADGSLKKSYKAGINPFAFIFYK